MKDYLHYENWAKEDVQHIATNYSINDIYDFICIQGLEDLVWDEWSDLESDEEKVILFLSIQKYPSIAMKELDEYINYDSALVNQLAVAYEEYRDMGDPCSYETRAFIRESVDEGDYLYLLEGIQQVIEDYELDLKDLPETVKAMKMLRKALS